MFLIVVFFCSFSQKKPYELFAGGFWFLLKDFCDLFIFQKSGTESVISVIVILYVNISCIMILFASLFFMG